VSETDVTPEGSMSPVIVDPSSLEPTGATFSAEDLNGLDLTDKVALQVPYLLAMIDDLNARIDVPKADLSNRELRRTIRDVKQLARVVTQLVRLVGNVLDSTNSGT